MPRIPHLRIIIEAEPNAGDWNMAVDEALLEAAIDREVATLRWYQWREPTLSLGYFQKSAELSQDSSFSKLPVVRRLSGGGAILHDNELTYSISLPSSQKLFQQPHELYDIVHESISNGLRQLGFPVDVRGLTLKRPYEPLLCFQRQDSHDVVLYGQKILGSAQRRRRGAIIQHGSLIRGASLLANQIPGLTDLCNATLRDDLARFLTTHLAEDISESHSFGNLTTDEVALVRRFSEEAVKNVLIR